MKRRRRYNFRPLIFIIVCLGLITALVFALLPKTTELQYDYCYNGLSGEGLIVRTEQATSLESYEKLCFEYLVDGQAVSSGSSIVTAYKKGYIQTTLEKLRETEKSIVQYQNQSIISGYDDKTITMLDFEIEVLIRKMSEENSGYIELYGSLCSKIARREEYIRATYNTDSNTYLQELYKDEVSLTESLSVWCDTFGAENDGFICFYCDGHEDIGTDTVASLTYEDIKPYFSGEQATAINAYKVVSDTKWYVAVPLSDTSGLTVGASYPVYIGNETESETALLQAVNEGKKYDVAVFELSDNVEKYIDFRTAQVYIGARYEGYSLPSEYVIDGTVIIKENKEKTSVPVNVLHDDGKTTVIEVNDSLNLGQKVYSK